MSKMVKDKVQRSSIHAKVDESYKRSNTVTIHREQRHDPEEIPFIHEEMNSKGTLKPAAPTVSDETQLTPKRTAIEVREKEGDLLRNLQTPKRKKRRRGDSENSR